MGRGHHEEAGHGLQSANKSEIEAILEGRQGHDANADEDTPVGADGFAVYSCCCHFEGSFGVLLGVREEKGMKFVKGLGSISRCVAYPIRTGKTRGRQMRPNEENAESIYIETPLLSYVLLQYNRWVWEIYNKIMAQVTRRKCNCIGEETQIDEPPTSSSHLHTC